MPESDFRKASQSQKMQKSFTDEETQKQSGYFFIFLQATFVEGNPDS
jgi:hypothetical protein